MQNQVLDHTLSCIESMRAENRYFYGKYDCPVRKELSYDITLLKSWEDWLRLDTTAPEVYRNHIEVISKTYVTNIRNGKYVDLSDVVSSLTLSDSSLFILRKTMLERFMAKLIEGDGEHLDMEYALLRSNLSNRIIPYPVKPPKNLWRYKAGNLSKIHVYDGADLINVLFREYLFINGYMIYTTIKIPYTKVHLRDAVQSAKTVAADDKAQRKALGSSFNKENKLASVEALRASTEEVSRKLLALETVLNLSAKNISDLQSKLTEFDAEQRAQERRDRMFKTGVSVVLFVILCVLCFYFFF